MYLFYATDIPSTAQVGQIIVLDAEESTHAVRVLRYTSGDTIYIADGCGKMYEAVIKIEQQTKHHRADVHIAVAPTKNIERIEWAVEKCTEIGIDTITPMLCRYSERKVIRNDRLQKIILSAAKQSLSAYLPRLNELTPIEDCIVNATEQRRYIAHSSPWLDKRDLRDELRSAQQSATGNQQSAIVLIGPEGGFSDEEVRLAIEHGFVPVSLGDARLRTETAAIVATMMVNYV